MKQSQSTRLSLLAKLFLAVLFITVFEGAIRKWVSNGLTFPIVGLRDLLVVFGILWAINKKKIRLALGAYNNLVLLSFLVIIWGLFQIIINETSFLVYLLGLRFWLLYLCFSILAGVSFTRYDFLVISRLLILLLILMTPLVVFQHFLPPSSFWNKQVEEGFIFIVSNDVVRTTGTFSFTAGYTTFLAMVSPFAIMVFDNEYKVFKTKWMQFLTVTCLLISTIVSGSRAAIVFFVILFVVFSFSSAIISTGKRRGNMFIYIILISTLATGLLSFFSRAVDATTDRFVSANESEPFLVRMAYTFFPQGEFDFVGHGIGQGNNFAGILQTGKRTSILAESEISRTLLEGGVIAYLILMLKIFVVFQVLLKLFKYSKYTKSFSAIIIWLTLAYALLVWPISGQLTINALGYLLFGLGVSSFQLEKLRYMACR